MKTIRFGLNYVPSKRWYYCWNDWNASEIAEDFDAIAALGVDHLRVQLIWPWFQPNPTYVSPLHLERLAQLMDLASERGLDVQISALTGFLSGYFFLPPSIAREEVFVKEEVIQQSMRFLEAVIGAIGPRKNFLGFDLGNEINVIWNDTPLQQGDAWGRRMLEFLRPKLGGKWIVNGTDHNPWFNGGVFTTRHLAADYDAVTIHAWPLFSGCLKRGGLTDAPSTQLSAFMTCLARHASAQSGVTRPIWIQEFGCSGEWGSLPERETFLRQSVPNAIQAGATWFTWWCSHDVQQRFRFSPLEYDLGLLTVENKPKPLAAVYRELITEFSNAPLPKPIAPEQAIPGIEADYAPRMLRKLPGEQWIEQNFESTTWPLFDRFLATLSPKA